MYPWVFYSALALTLISTVLLVIDVENEIKVNDEGEAVYDDTLEYLETGKDTHLI
jgi:hypothetical protein